MSLTTGMGQASTALGLRPRAIAKLIECGILTDRRDPAARNVALKTSQIEKLATRPRLHLPHGTNAIAVHLGPPDTDAAGRPYGYHKTRYATLTPTQQLDTWTRWWPVAPANAERMAAENWLLIGDICGYIPDCHHIRTITGIIPNPNPDIYGTRIGFDTAPLTDTEASQYAKTRFTAAPGQIWQQLP